MAPSLNVLPKAVCLPLLILAWLSVMLAQGQGPRCYPAGVSCSDEEGAEVLSYAQCCSQPRPETLEYVRDSGDCMPCGPVIEETATEAVPTGTAVLMLQWSLASGSRPAVRYTVTLQAENDSFVLRSTVIATRAVYTALLVGVRYTFTVAGEDEDGHTSETVAVSAVAQIFISPETGGVRSDSEGSLSVGEGLAVGLSLGGFMVLLAVVVVVVTCVCCLRPKQGKLGPDLESKEDITLHNR